MRLVQSGTSYLSQSDMRAHFGVGKAGRIDSLTVRWPNGKTTTQTDIPTNRVIRVTPGALNSLAVVEFLSLES